MGFKIQKCLWCKGSELVTPPPRDQVPVIIIMIFIRGNDCHWHIKIVKLALNFCLKNISYLKCGY